MTQMKLSLFSFRVKAILVLDRSAVEIRLPTNTIEITRKSGTKEIIVFLFMITP